MLHYEINRWTSLVEQWMRIRLSMQGTRIQSLVQKDAHDLKQLSPCTTATEPTCRSDWAQAPQLLSPHAAVTEPRHNSY